jgi:hypothetical protein
MRAVKRKFFAQDGIAALVIDCNMQDQPDAEMYMVFYTTTKTLVQLTQDLSQVSVLVYFTETW